MKYQFCIRFKDIDVNSAANKAVQDCNTIFSAHGYEDYTFTVGDNSKKLSYYFSLVTELIRFFLAIKSGSLVGIQYPLLSINNVFRYFIQVCRFKNVKFFCIIHDLESLRTGGTDAQLIQEEIKNLSYFNIVIAHNTQMIHWLRAKGLKRPMIALELFDYLNEHEAVSPSADGEIVFAGNLSKSRFIYSLGKIGNRNFKVYGPNYNNSGDQPGDNRRWAGQFGPDEIPKQLEGSFGLIWDGDEINVCDSVLGNYMKYNNPHKFSLYIAAGLPVIAPRSSAIGHLISKLNVGVLVNSLYELEDLKTDERTYKEMVLNVSALRKKVVSGYYFGKAIRTVEESVWLRK